MEPIRMTRTRTAIPPRFGAERERVLRILARWEETTRSTALRWPAVRQREVLRSEQAGIP